MTYIVTRKADAMMAAKLITDIASADILTHELLRGGTNALRRLRMWTDESPPIVEVRRSVVLALRRSMLIEDRARALQSTALEASVLDSFHREVIELSAVLRVKFRENRFGSGTAEDSEDNDVYKTRRYPKDGGAKTDTLDEDVSVSSSLSNSLRFLHQGLGDDYDLSGTQDMGSDRPVATTEEDIRCAISKSSRWRFAMCGCIILSLIAGSLMIILEQRAEYVSQVEDLERNVSYELAYVAQTALNCLYDLYSSFDGSSLRTSGVDMASSVLSELTLATSRQHTTFVDGLSHIYEFRGAVQDFRNDGQVTQVTTERIYKSMCQKNETFPIHPMNDIRSNQSLVLTVLTPDDCDDDATARGIFSSCTPSFTREKPWVSTYRRSTSRAATFVQSGFGLSVAVTYDRKTLQALMTPKESLVRGEASVFHSSLEGLENGLLLWCGLSLVMATLMILLLSMWMTRSRTFRGWRRVVFPLIMLFIVGGALTAVYFISEYVVGDTLVDVHLAGATSLVQAVAAGAVASGIANNNLTSVFVESLWSGFFNGRVLLSDPTGSTITPSSMEGVGAKINSREISTYRRARFAQKTNGYIVSSTFVSSLNQNFFYVEKADSSFYANGVCLVAVILFGLTAGAITYGFMAWTSLTQVAVYGAESTFLRYHVHGSTVRILFFVVFATFSMVGMICGNVYGVSLLSTAMTTLAESSAVLLSSCLRAPSVVDICTSGCGMPDSVLTLYFADMDEDDTGTIFQFVTANLPLPLPDQPDWMTHYVGAMLISSHTSSILNDVPSYATPLVNRTTNVVNPRWIIRNMLAATAINDTAGFSIERFPSSYYPRTYSFVAHSIGIAIMVVVCAVVISVCEWQYLKLHERFHKKQSMRPPLVVMCCTILLVLAGFIIQGGVMRYFIKLELTYFVERELSLIVNSLSYRFRLIALEKPLSVGELIDKLTEVTTDVSDSAMVSGNSFLRVRIAYEYPNRGSGMVKITGNMPNAGVPVSIGNLDKMYTPVCGLIDGEWIGRYTKEEMHFCFSEVPQTVKNVLNAPRVFLLAATSEATWVSTPVKQSWPSIFGMLVLIACIIILLSFLIFIPSMLAAKAKGFPIYRDSECIWFGEPVPVKTFTQEYFIPRRHRLVWVFLSIIALSVIYVYYGTTINNLMTVLQDSGAVSAPYKNQKDILTDLTVDAVTSAMSYLIFPLPDVTLGELLVYRDGAGAKTLPYVFIGDAALSSFQNSMQVIYNNLTGTNGILNDILSVADTGYGSYASLFAVRYETMFIAVQQSVMSGLQRMETFVEQNLGSVASTEYAVLVEFEFQILQLRELLRKLYILDHIVISSYADVAGVNEASWPWPDDTDLSVLVSKASAAAQDLRNQVNTATTALNSIISSLNSAFEQSLSYTFGDTTDMYSMSYAMGSLTSTIWGLQASRCNDAKLAGNHTVDDIASAQKEQELACIAAQESLLSEIITSEGSIRKSSQMRIYLSQSEPLNNLMTAVGWQRKENLQNGLEQSIVVFVCTLVGFSAVAVMMVTHFRLLEYKTQMTQPPRMTAKDATKHRPRRASSATSPSPSGAALSGKEVYEGQMEEKDQPSSEPSLVGKHSAASPREGKIDYGVAKIVSPLKFGDDDVHKAREGREQADGVPLSDDGEEEYDSTNGRRERQPRGHASPPPASHWRRRGWVIVPLLGFLLISLVPLCCSFWLYQLAHTVVSDTLFQIDIILSLYSKVESLVNTLDQLLEVTAKHYLGVINEETYEAFMNSLEAQISQLNYAFLWDMFVDSSVYVTNVETTYQKVLSILADEIDSFDNAVGSGDTLDYFTPQSWYGRTILPTLSSDNTYGALLPPGVTTGGSDVNTFATDLYNTAKTNIPAAASSAEFTSLFTAYAAACTALDHISDAELQMWHAVVAATRTNGAPVAVQYSTFKNLVSESSLSGITSSSEASAPAAKAEVEDYFAALLSATATTEDITALFTESDTEPATSTPPVSADAYTMAGYVTTLMNTMVSETKFANVYAYNRNLTQNSANLKGQKTLVEAIEDLKDAVEGLLSAVGTEGEIVIKPATMNEWIWYSEVSFRKATLRDHEDLTYLGDAVRWTVIISFWGLLIPIYFLVYAAYLRSGAL